MQWRNIGRNSGAALLCAVFVAVAFVAIDAFASPQVPVRPPSTSVPLLPTIDVPQPEVPVSTPLATPQGEITAYDSPDGQEIAKVGTWYGYPMTMPILEERGDWLLIRLPERPNGLTAWVKADHVTRSATAWRLVVDLSDTTVRVYRDGFEQWSSPVGIGKDSTRTPTGEFFVAVIEKPGRGGYGPVVLNLNAHSEDILSWQGAGDAIIAFHGPFGSEELLKNGGGKVSNGCFRMLLEDQLKLDVIPLGTPVDIIA